MDRRIRTNQCSLRSSSPRTQTSFRSSLLSTRLSELLLGEETRRPEICRLAQLASFLLFSERAKKPSSFSRFFLSQNKPPAAQAITSGESILCLVRVSGNWVGNLNPSQFPLLSCAQNILLPVLFPTSQSSPQGTRDEVIRMSAWEASEQTSLACMFCFPRRAPRGA